MRKEASLTPAPLRACAFASSRGAQTGALPVGMSYRVTLWVAGALSKEQESAWAERKAERMAAMAATGQKGARGKLAEIAESLNRDFVNLIETPLMEGAHAVAQTGVGMSEQQAELLACAIVQGAERGEYELMAWGMYANHVKVVVEPCGEKVMSEVMAAWMLAAPTVQWSVQHGISGMTPGECERAVMQLINQLGACASADAGDAGTAETDSTKTSFAHTPVLLNEAVEALNPAVGKVYVDCTLGGGGHAELLLQRGATVWGIDQDVNARRAAVARLGHFGGRFKVLAGNFRNLTSLMQEHGVLPVDGVLADLGVSSPQLDQADRGFSFRNDGPLDMRMNLQEGKTAADLVNDATEQELADWIWIYGEERESRRVARAIVGARTTARISTTQQLARVVESVIPRKGKNHPATRVFQALRIAVNDELGALDDLLEATVPALKTGGRMAVITFHSLEDRCVKKFMERKSHPEIDRPEWPSPRPNPEYCLRVMTRKPVVATAEELKNNVRTRSAKLRVAEKIAT